MNCEAALTEWLSRPETYDAEGAVECVETHISRVFLVADHAYKLKKPVRFEFLDFSTVEARRNACEAELRLNRRLAGDVYQAVVPIYQSPDGQHTWESTGQPVDWVVRMQRLDTTQTLEQVIRNSSVQDAELDRLSALLNRFYQNATAVDITAAEYLERIEHHVRANLEDLSGPRHGLSAQVVQRVHGAQFRLLLLQPRLFEHRVGQGRVIDGHGDLRPEHVVLADPPVVFDCLEFSADLRQIDVADELAFLAMECEQLNAADVGARIWESWTAFSQDQPPDALLSFYKSYRACVRAKVCALRAGQEAGHAHDQDQGLSQRYLNLADRYAGELPAPDVVLVCGISGTGKSTLAREIAARLCGRHLSTDTVRREVFGPGPSAAAAGQGNYRPAARQAVYDELFRRADRLLAQGILPILDGTFLRAAQRQQVVSLAKRHGCRPLVVHCDCPAAVAAERIRERLAAQVGDSEARPELLAEQAVREEPPVAEEVRFEVDTTVELREQVRRVLEHLCY